MKQKTAIKNMKPPELTEKRIEAILERLRDNKQVRRALPLWGRVHIDRPLPFLCVYRRPSGRLVPGTDRLISSGASYITAPGQRSFHPQLARLLERLTSHMMDRFGAYMILEVWADQKPKDAESEPLPRAGFRVLCPADFELPSTIKVLQEKLLTIRTKKLKAEVVTSTARKIAPPGMAPLLTAKTLQEHHSYLLGLEVKPVYFNEEANDIYPLLLRAIRRQLNPVFKRTFYHFAKTHTTYRPSHYHALGRRAMVKAVWDVDNDLAAVSNSFDFLYQITPVNTEEAWKTFQRNQFEKKPFFLYRPCPIDPALMKRKLYNIRIERVEDPTLIQLFIKKQMELDRQLSMLHDLDSKKFLYGSLQLHGDVSSSLVNAAREVLDHTPSRSRQDTRGGVLTATECADLAKAVVSQYLR
ncbi:MAG: tyrosine/phenylalanine carboxypeptidase domain-containing protein [Candidatus Latescibacterota bacterium]